MREPSAERYDIDATAGHPVSRRDIVRMLQALLTDRFKVSLHRETKEALGYALVVGIAGPKFRASADPEGANCNIRRNAGGELQFENCSLSFSQVS
jgi:uncharacterized protein (TIGR03435 family)